MRVHLHRPLINQIARRSLALSPIVIVSVAISASAGIWVKAGPAAQVNLACTQVWQCTVGQDVLHSDDTYVWTTPNKITVGVCNAAGGPIDSCNECAASPPDQPCTWELRQKGQ